MICIMMTDNKINVELAEPELWKKFHSNTTEMVVTKTGRKMFPKLEYKISGLDPDSMYGLSVQIEQVGDARYKFSGGEWSISGRGEVISSTRQVIHSDGAMNGRHWMNQNISFEKIKITNNQEQASDNTTHIYLASMTKCIPVLTIFKLEPNDSRFLRATSPHTHRQIATIRDPLTEFIAVTAYQNNAIKELKIEYNPFAKGFRDGGCDRKRSSPDGGSSPKTPKMIRLESEHQSPMMVMDKVLPSPMSGIHPMFMFPYINQYMYPPSPLFSPLLAQYRFGIPK